MTGVRRSARRKKNEEDEEAGASGRGGGARDGGEEEGPPGGGGGPGGGRRARGGGGGGSGRGEEEEGSGGGEGAPGGGGGASGRGKGAPGGGKAASGGERRARGGGDKGAGGSAPSSQESQASQEAVDLTGVRIDGLTDSMSLNEVKRGLFIAFAKDTKSEMEKRLAQYVGTFDKIHEAFTGNANPNAEQLKDWLKNNKISTTKRRAPREAGRRDAAPRPVKDVAEVAADAILNLVDTITNKIQSGQMKASSQRHTKHMNAEGRLDYNETNTQRTLNGEHMLVYGQESDTWARVVKYEAGGNSYLQLATGNVKRMSGENLNNAVENNHILEAIHRMKMDNTQAIADKLTACGAWTGAHDSLYKWGAREVSEEEPPTDKLLVPWMVTAFNEDNKGEWAAKTNAVYERLSKAETKLTCGDKELTVRDVQNAPKLAYVKDTRSNVGELTVLCMGARRRGEPIGFMGGLLSRAFEDGCLTISTGSRGKYVSLKHNVNLVGLIGQRKGKKNAEKVNVELVSVKIQQLDHKAHPIYLVVATKDIKEGDALYYGDKWITAKKRGGGKSD